MMGTIVNTGAIIAGSIIGMSAGKHLPERIRTTVMHALGLSVLLIGVQMALSGKEVLVTIACVLLGAITGECLKIEQTVEHLGTWLKKHTRSESGTFVQGFVTASILYLTGAMMIVGSIQDGTVGDASTLYIKSLLDGVASIALASLYGIGVAFSALSVFIIQGCVTILSSQLHFLQNPDVLNTVVGTGGLLIIGIGTNILNITTIRIGNLLPAVFYAILWPLL